MEIQTIIYKIFALCFGIFFSTVITVKKRQTKDPCSLDWIKTGPMGIEGMSTV
jgi:hypothetical protein